MMQVTSFTIALVASLGHISINKKCVSAAILFFSACFASQVDGAASEPASSEKPVWGWVANQPVYPDEARFWQRFIHRNQELDARSAGLEKPALVDQKIAEYVCQQRGIRRQALKENIRFTDLDEAAYQQQRQKNMLHYGGGLEYLRQLVRMYQSERMHHQLYETEVLAERLFAHWYGKQGEKAPTDTVSQYIERRELIHLNWLYQPLDQPADRLRQARTALMDSHDPAEELAVLRRQFEDERLARHPKGRLLSRQLLPASVVKVMDSQEIGLPSQVIEANDGRYVAIRLPLSATDTVNNSSRSLGYWAARQLLFQPRIESACSGVDYRLARSPG